MERIFINLFALISLAQAEPPALVNFGYGNIRINGFPAQGQRPLLIILADTAPPDNTPNEDPLAHPVSYYHDRTRNFFSFPSVNGFLLENALGDFILSNAGIVDMIDRPGHDGVEFSDAERRNWNLPDSQERDARIYGDTINAAKRAGYDFAQHDANGNKVIEQHELMVLIVMNDSDADNGAARSANPAGLGTATTAPPPFIIAGTTMRFNSLVCAVTHRVSFATLAHELLHLIGLEDLYVNGLNTFSNARQTLAGPTISTPDNMDSYHLDPWHKLQFGWCEPQIMDMQKGGVVFSLQPNQGNSPSKHLILYDSARGDQKFREFFILEYRTRMSGAFAGYDGQTNDNGLVIWHIHHDASGGPIAVPTPYVRGDAAPDNPADPKTIGFQLGMMGGVFTLAPPSFAVGGGSAGPPDLGGAWDSGITTPRLRWTIFPGVPKDYSDSDYDGAPSLARVRVLPFVENASGITLEVFTDADTWVDFNYHTGPMNGSFSNPFNNLPDGLGEVGWGGNLRIKSSNTLDTISNLSKPMTLTAEGGPVRIGPP